MKTKQVEFAGETYTVPAGKNPMSAAQAQRMQKSLRAPETSPRPAPRPSGSGTPKNSNKASSPSPRTSQRPSPRPSTSTGNSQSVSGDPRTSDGYNRIGASNPSTQKRTSGASRAYTEGNPSKDSKGRVNYKGYQAAYDRAAKANDAQLSSRSRSFARGRQNVRNAAAVREMYRRDNAVPASRRGGRK